jgi:hypothetical protein
MALEKINKETASQTFIESVQEASEDFIPQDYSLIYQSI